jgi:hypothetical protein
LLTAGFGTLRTSRDVRFRAALGGNLLQNAARFCDWSAI